VIDAIRAAISDVAENPLSARRTSDPTVRVKVVSRYGTQHGLVRYTLTTVMLDAGNGRQITSGYQAHRHVYVSRTRYPAGICEGDLDEKFGFSG